MSTEEDLRRLIDEPADNSNYESAKLTAILAAHNGSLNLAAAQVWTEKAAKYSALVDMQEGESKRNLSDLMKNAMAMAKVLRDSATAGDTGIRPVTMSRIVRP